MIYTTCMYMVGLAIEKQLVHCTPWLKTVYNNNNNDTTIYKAP